MFEGVHTPGPRLSRAQRVRPRRDPHYTTRKAHRGILVDQTATNGQTISDVHAYAVATYSPTPSPGANPAAVTDTFIEAAVKAVASKDSTATS